MRENRTYGSVRGALSNERPYRNPQFTITNYTGSITKTPLEAPFQAHAWAG